MRLLRHRRHGEFADVLGLWKVVSTDEIEEQDYSLTPANFAELLG